MGPLGYPEMIFIFILALLLFGPKKLPELGKTVGKAMTEFRRASSELKATFDREMRTLEAENESLKEATRSYTDTYNYDYSSYDSGYNYESQDSTATEVSTASASAPQGAESQSVAAAPEGAIAQGSEIAAGNGPLTATPESSGSPAPEPAAATSKHPATD